MLEKLLAAIKGVTNYSEESWLKFQEELNKVSAKSLEICHGLENKSLPLFLAIESENPKIVQALIEKCPAITHVLNDKGQHALFWVNDYGNIGDILLPNMTTSLITCSDKEDNNILHIQAGIIGNAKIFAKLCEAFPWLVNLSNLNKETPLLKTTDIQKAQILIEKMSIEAIYQQSSFFIEYEPYKSSTILHRAVLADNKEMIEFLITKFLDLLRIPNADDKTPYEIARSNIKKLIDNLIPNHHKIEENDKNNEVKPLTILDENKLQESSCNGQIEEIDSER